MTNILKVSLVLVIIALACRMAVKNGSDMESSCDAMYEYKQALHTKINDPVADKRIMLAYSLQCVLENRGCEYTIFKLNELLSKYPDDKELCRMLSNCKEHISDTADLEYYYSILTGSE